MSILLRFLLVVLASISLAGARYASQHFGSRPGATQGVQSPALPTLRVSTHQ